MTIGRAPSAGSAAVRYCSTRGGVSGLPFTEAVLCGLAEDGGLLVPETVPVVADLARLKGLAYCDLCYEILRLYIQEADVPGETLKRLIHSAYESFSVPDCVRYSAVITDGQELTLMELFHGPTFAFKDFALQFLGKLVGWLLQQRNESITILGATSGDTGSAAISGFQGVPNVRCCILYPDGKTSELQELQMITAAADNVQCLALDGACFDDCQSIVKALFQSPLKTKLKLSAVNSINWARILAQTVYYWHGSLRAERIVDVVVPTGNFGNALAAHYARLSGAPIRRVVLAANSNDCLPRFLTTGRYFAQPVIQTMSPSMDIQLASNFERGIFLCTGRDGDLIKDLFGRRLASEHKGFELDTKSRTPIIDAFKAFKATEEDTAATIKKVFESQNLLLDPHTAVGVHCATLYLKQRETGDDTPVIVVATAHCGKFPEALAKVISPSVAEDSIPPALKHLRTLPTKYKRVAATREAVAEFLESFALCK